MGTETAKALLRQEMRAALRGTTGEERAHWSAAIRLHLQEAWAARFPPRGIVAIFAGMAGEPDLLPLLPWFHQQGWRTAVFGIGHGLLTPYLIEGEHHLVRGAIGVYEPIREPSRQIAMSALSVVLAPGLAFGRGDGARLGRGAGHYDRTLGPCAPRPFCAGVAFDLQVPPSAPVEDFDVPMDAIVTERGFVFDAQRSSRPLEVHPRP